MLSVKKYNSFLIFFMVLFVTVGCDDTSKNKDKVYHSEIKTKKKFNSKESKEVPILKPEIDKGMLLTEEESLIVAKRHLNYYIIENYGAKKTNFSLVGEIVKKRHSSTYQRERPRGTPDGLTEGKYYFLLEGFSSGDRCWVNDRWYVSVDPLLGEGVSVKVIGYPTCN